MADAPPESTQPAPAPGPAPAAALPRVAQSRRLSVSLVWLLPLLAVAIGVLLLVRTVLLSGPFIEIEFASADGVEAGKTDVRYKEVVIGKVKSVSLRDDHQRVIVGVQLNRTAAGFNAKDTTFWVVRPRFGSAGISGLGTLISGAYIGSDVGTADETKSEYVGLEVPPLVLRGEPGRVFVLGAEDLGSLDVGSPVFHRRARVGRVVAYTLDAERDALSVKIFVEAPYEKLVTGQTRFWNASGIDLKLNASGLTINTQTLASVILGGIAFETPASAAPAKPAKEDTVFPLFSDRSVALAPPDGQPVRIRMVFDQSVRGLAEGATVDLFGIDLGRVTSIAIRYDSKRERFPIEVQADVFPDRLGPVRDILLKADGNDGSDAAVLKQLVKAGMRAQLRTGNLLTGQLYVAVDFIGKGPATSTVAADGALTLPTVPGTLSELQPQIAAIISRFSKIPFDDIGKNLRQTLQSANAAIGRLTPEAQHVLGDVRKTLTQTQRSLDRLEGSVGKTLDKATGTLERATSAIDNLDRNITGPEAPLQRNVEETLRELQRASRSLRVLADYLQAHPESILRGKPADPVLVPQR